MRETALQKRSHSISSCDKMVSSRLFTKFTPSPNATTPAVFIVPLSKRSGGKSGCKMLSETLPVPPSIMVSSGKSPSEIIRPVPIGPYSPLCPAAQIMFAPFSSEIGNTPAPCAASSIKHTPCFRHISASSSIGARSPVTFDAAVQISAAVSAFKARSAFFTVCSVSADNSNNVQEPPYFSDAANTGRITALCSISLVTKLHPSFAIPFIAKFSAWVQFSVNTVFSAFAPK